MTAMGGTIGVAFLFTLLAGLSTGIGSAIAYFIRRPKPVYLTFSLGFSAGVMVYVSFVELLPSSFEALGASWGVLAFFLGIGFIALIDLLIPEEQNPHDYKSPTDICTESASASTASTESASASATGTESASASATGTDPRLMRTGLVTALAIAIHNFPEGLATFGTALTDVRLGGVIALAIAIHNIPEGISVSVPILYATGDRRKAFIYSFLSGLAEPVGAIIGFLILLPFLSPALLAALLGFVAGIMVYISLDELLPMAHRYGRGHIVIFGIVLGMLVMAISLLML